MPYSIERFGLGHSLITNRIPKGVTTSMLEAIKEEPTLDISSFGLFEVSAPDFNKYYPDVTAEDLNPKDADYIMPLFRALSKIIVNKHGPIDFSQGDVLKKSMHLLKGQALYTNHEQVVGNEVGVVFEVSYQEQKTYAGVTVPAGINFRPKIDGKSNPKLARSIMMDPPSVHSVSVTIGFNWEQSHKNLTRDEFMQMVGTLDDKGKLIRRVVVDIERYEEVSLVSHGADPFAQKINDDGKIVNPEYAGKVYKFAEGNNREIYHYIDWKDYGSASASFSLNDTIPSNLKETDKTDKNNKTKTLQPMNEQLLQFFRSKFGMADTATEAEVTAKLQAEIPLLIADRSSLTVSKDNLTKLTQDLTNLTQKYPEGSTVISSEDKTKLSQFDAQAAILTGIITATRAECLKLYHLSVGGAEKADSGITKLIAESPISSLSSLTKQYRTQVESKFEATCKDCGSHSFTRASSANAESGVVDSDGNTSTDGKTVTIRNTGDVSAELHRKATAQRVVDIHGPELTK